MKNARNEYGELTQEFLNDLRPHEAKLKESVDELMEMGYHDSDIFVQLFNTVSGHISFKMFRQSVDMRKKEKGDA
tara:strand:- start:994 stop:1218 length:225 start_codon:yes stop_codon:yes gene_type:complete